MHKARIAVVAALVAGSTISLGFATQPARSSRQSSPIIHRKMEQMEEAFEALGEALKAKQAKESLKQIEALQENVIDAKSQTPGIVKRLDKEEKETKTAEFRRHLVGALKTLCEVELLILDEDYEAASTMLSETLHSQEREAHELFKPKREG